jgi:hypothetical protein
MSTQGKIFWEVPGPALIGHDRLWTRTVLRAAVFERRLGTSSWLRFAVSTRQCLAHPTRFLAPSLSYGPKLGIVLVMAILVRGEGTWGKNRPILSATFLGRMVGQSVKYVGISSDR